jgi:hypothetical protein
MTHATTPIALHSLPSQPGVQRVRLMRGPSGTVAVLARPGDRGRPHEPAPLAIESLAPGRPDSRTRLFTVPRMLPGSPDWDVSLGLDGRPHLAVTDFGGAINSLSMLTASGQAPLVPLNESDDLRDPRFVRGPRGGHAVTALADDRQVVLFQPRPSGGYAPARLLAAGTQMDNALLLDTASGWVLLTRRMELGPQRGRFPGVLEARPLAPDLTPGGPAFPVFGAERIFDFDADVTPTGFAVLAIVDGGFALARLARSHPPRIERQPHAPLSGPVSLLAEGAVLHLAFLAPRDRILLGETAG